jgi:NTE family protein
VGSINAAYLAANSELNDHGVERLIQVWRSLKLGDHARVRPLGLARWPNGLRGKLKLLGDVEAMGTSLLDTRANRGPGAAEHRLGSVAPRDRQRPRFGLADRGAARASGRTTMFTEAAPDEGVPTKDERRTSVFERITADHVLASAAIPLLFPTRRIGAHYYCDGGLRFNTPIAPAIRAARIES